jgi:tRNA (guanosine-2'-O-)-methyltransferase
MTPERFAKLREALSRRQPDLTVLADGVNKSHNISAILRTADAVGIGRIHAISVSGALRRHHMIAGGAKQWVEVALYPSIDVATAKLKQEGWRLLAAQPGANARDFRDVDYTAKVAILVGAELGGLSAPAVAAADELVCIPMLGLGRSLNVSVAAAILLMEAARQRRAAGLYEHSRLDPQEFARTLFAWAYPEIAALCRARGEPYPALTADGYLASNSSGESVTAAQ